MNLTIAELNEVLYCLRQVIRSKPELLDTDTAMSAMDKVYDELETRVNGVINSLAEAEANAVQRWG